MVIDCHVHILNAEDGHLDELLSAADRTGIDKMCISSLSRQWVEFPTAEQLEEAAKDVLDACAKHPDRFIGFTYVSADHVEKSLALMERCIAAGPCCGLKLWLSQFADDARLDPIVKRAVELDAPILAHTWIKATGNMRCESTFHHVMALARRHPRMKIWMAHCSGRWEEVGRAVRCCPNVCLDISGGEPEDGIVETLVKDAGPERVFYGSDAPGRNPAVQITKVLAADIPQAWKKMVLGENVRGWLHV